VTQYDFSARTATQSDTADLFGTTTLPSTSIVGLLVSMADRPCRTCGSTNFVVGAGKAMHAASVMCSACGRHGGWVSQASYAFINEVVDVFGRPEQPIIVRRSSQ
jgi:hypothetical protein